MKKQTLLFATLCLSLGFAAVRAHAQTNRTLPEGEYLIASAKEKVFVQNAQGKTLAMVLSNAVSGRAVGKTGQVVFQCYDQHCFLSELWSPTQDAGRQLLKCQWEKEVAKRETAKYFALIGAPENQQR